MNIRIKRIPEGSLPLCVRQELVGGTFEVATDVAVRDGYAITLEECIRKLRLAGKDHIADVIVQKTNFPLHSVIEIDEDDCEVIL